ncbi:MAG: TonB family protein [Crocinitomicaceae bacterium]|nr:TonB family protein [Crocinitomicaceae bacterium]
MAILLFHIVSLGLLYGVYETSLKRMKWYTFNRIILVSLPILPILLFWISQNSYWGMQVSSFNPVQLEAIVVERDSLIEVTGVHSPIQNSWLLVYMIGCSVMGVYIGLQYYFTIKMIRRISFKEIGESRLRLGFSEKYSSFSFFRYIVLNTQNEGMDAIKKHEMKHALAGHSVDLMIYNLYKVMFWYNPFVFLLERDVKLNHECEADQFASGNNQVEYANSLLNQVFGANQIQFINQFNNQKSIKMRIKMLKQQRKGSLFRYVSILPILGLVFILGSWNSTNQWSHGISSLNILGDGDSVYDKVEKMPEFPGGMDALIKYMQKEIKYPKEAEKNNIQGKVMIEFIVDKEGQVTHAKVLNGVDENLNNEALRVVKAMPNWTPGEDKGKKVKVKMVLPIIFKL